MLTITVLCVFVLPSTHVALLLVPLLSVPLLSLPLHTPTANVIATSTILGVLPSLYLFNLAIVTVYVRRFLSLSLCLRNSSE